MTANELLNSVRKELEQHLAAKTGWGRNEVMQAFDRACVAALCKKVEVQP